MPDKAKFDGNRVIFQIQAGDQSGQRTIYDMSQNLCKKHADRSVHLFMNIQNYPITERKNGNGPEVIGPNTKVYIVAHGQGNGITVAGLLGNQMADMFASALTKGVRKVVIVACCGVPTPEEMAKDSKFLTNFASLFHRQLGTHNVFTEVSAYGGFMTVDNAGHKKVITSVTSDGGFIYDFVAKADKVKKTYFWQGDVQKFRSDYKVTLPQGEPMDID
ncbi:MAG TPA: C80 family cysteine peptidase [Aliidongia sp.]|nr:C80 family cysteine peptidase [Aliidongia sp.]